MITGGHTTGQAKCVLFRNRIYNETNLIDSSFATSVKSSCPSSGDDDKLSSLDTTTPVIFDNGYFKNLMNQKGLLHSDQQLFSNGSTDSLVTTYSKNSAVFFEDFAAAMLKMGRLGPLTGTDGQIRSDCRKANWSWSLWLVYETNAKEQLRENQSHNLLITSGLLGQYHRVTNIFISIWYE